MDKPNNENKNSDHSKKLLAIGKKMNRLGKVKGRKLELLFNLFNKHIQQIYLEHAGTRVGLALHGKGEEYFYTLAELEYLLGSMLINQARILDVENHKRLTDEQVQNLEAERDLIFECVDDALKLSEDMHGKNS